MKSKDAAFLALRVLSVYIFVQALYMLSIAINFTFISNFINLKSMVDDKGLIILGLIFGSLFPFLILLISGIILWKYTDSIVSKMIPRQEDTVETEAKTNLKELQAIAFSVIGLIILANTIPELFNLIPSIIQMNEIRIDLATDTFKLKVTYAVITNLVKLLIGFALFFGGKGLVGLLHKARELGVKE